MKRAEIEALAREGSLELEPIRSKASLTFILAWGIGAGTLALIAFAVSRTLERYYVWLLVLGGIPTLVLVIMAKRLSGRLHSEFERWRQGVWQKLAAGSHFQPNNCVARNDFDASGLNRWDYTDYGGRNWVAVNGIEASALNVSHTRVEVYYDTEYYYDPGTKQQCSRQVRRERTIVTPVFNGVFIIARAPFRHQVRVTITPDKGAVPSGLQRTGVSQPYLDSNYLIGVSDRHLGHTLLSPALMQEISNIASSQRYLPGFSFTGGTQGRVYLAVPGLDLSFGKRPGVWRTVTERGLEEVIDQCAGTLAFLQTMATRLQPR